MHTQNFKFLFHITSIIPEYIPMEQVKTIFPFIDGVKSTSATPLKGMFLLIPKEGILNWDVQPNLPPDFKLNLTGIPCLTCTLLGLYPVGKTAISTICTPFSVNSPSDKSIEIGIASRIVCKVTGDPAKTSAPLKEVTPKYKTSIPAILKNLVLKVSPKVVVKNPRPKNKGKVPKTKVAIIAAPKIGEPDDMAKTSMAKVVPQGIKIVKAPSRAGANKSLLLVVFLTHFIINRGGWIITYLKMGWTFNKFKAMAIM